MFEFLNNTDPALKMFWYVALPTSIIFLIQLVLTFAGADANDGADVDFNGDFDSETPFQLFSFRNLINFLLGFSWGGISLWNTIENKSLLVLVAFLIGAFFFFVFLLIMRQLAKLQEDNTSKIQDTLNRTGSVYINIPGSKSGIGKIQISVKGAQREYNAITLGESISSGSAIRVVEILDDSLCLVENL